MPLGTNAMLRFCRRFALSHLKFAWFTCRAVNRRGVRTPIGELTY
jgi:hypothetical protein